MKTLRVSSSILVTVTVISSPLFRSFKSKSVGNSDTCNKPTSPSPISINAPYSFTDLILPVTSTGVLNLSDALYHGSLTASTGF